jgi:hypothetical protein
MQMHWQRVELDSEYAPNITTAVSGFLAEVDKMTADLTLKYKKKAGI